MGLTYRNLRGDMYYLQRKADARGKVRVWLGRELTGEVLDEVPPGFEIFEKPENAQPFVRRMIASPILATELEQVRRAVERQMGHGMSRAEIEGRRGKEIVIYLSDVDIEARLEMLSAIFPGAKSVASRDYMMRQRSFGKMMRMTLVDESRRLFSVDRWCFKGSIDDWYFLEGGAPLPKQISKYVKHLGRESFFNLM